MVPEPLVFLWRGWGKSFDGKKKTCYGLGVLLQTAHLMSVNGKLLMFFFNKTISTRAISIVTL